MATQEDIQQAMTSGFTFKGSSGGHGSSEKKVRTKAKKKLYITGAHGSGAAQKKADIRKRRANRPSQKRK